MNTVGKKERLGENIRCVVSVSMLTEGWDANTVTHILGVRAFGTRLLCEQVMGRGLRRRNYTVGDDGMLTPEYADIFGVPFSGFPVAGLPETRTPPTPKPGKAVRAVPERLIESLTSSFTSWQDMPDHLIVQSWAESRTGLRITPTNLPENTQYTASTSRRSWARYGP